MAAREAITFAWETGFRDVILKGDNINVMNAIRSSEVGLSSGGVIVSMSCKRVSFSFVKRDGNCIAHSLAKFVRTVADFVVWLEDLPDWLDDCLLCDVSHLN